MSKSHFEQQMEKLDHNYNRYFQTTLKQLQKEYKEAYKTIEVEIIKWYKAMEEIKATNPNFQFSELKYLEELTKQIDLILKDLSRLESDVVQTSLSELYVSDYIDLAKLNGKYANMANSPLPEFNQLKSTQLLEVYMNMPQASSSVVEIAKQLDLSWWYSPIHGKWFNTRIEERAKKLGYSIESKLKQAIIRGDSYHKVAGQLMNDLDISFKSAKTLVQTELRTAEITAKIHNAMKNGYTHMQRSSMRDSHVCKLCQSLDGTIYPLDSVTAGDFILHPNDRCVLVEVIVDSKGNPVRSSYYDEAQEYVKARAKANAERTKKIREQHKLNK
ncbi:hypothetical protein GMC23_14510 [Turicibacter sanguinis]|nr:hypothetical protein [Turicibacter sanguinis]DAN56590.1 MAG TPA: minor capsid protein [Caudoviricetes sp.]MTO28153.1 hypothetical protein [Turicibacter sanguinis]MTO91093.1 hypothetical protein [Turicibacter sanguinis]MTP71255.1 hypothetical protein [Turicibacter sanguinis]